MTTAATNVVEIEDFNQELQQLQFYEQAIN